jgi:hypothetical protein
MEIKTDDYSITYDADTATVFCKGSLLLTSGEYAPILQLFNDAAEQQPKTLTLNVKELEFLNSSGINTFTKFVVKVRKAQGPQLIAVGCGELPWQVRFLKNMQRLLPSLTLKME